MDFFVAYSPSIKYNNVSKSVTLKSAYSPSIKYNNVSKSVTLKSWNINF